MAWIILIGSLMMLSALANAGEITLYQDSQFGKGYQIYTGSSESLPGFNDEASSLKVKSGTWVLYKDSQYRGTQWVVGPGEYPSPGSWGGSNDDISSIRLLGNCQVTQHMIPKQSGLRKVQDENSNPDVIRELLVNPAVTPEIILYEDDGFAGSYQIYRASSQSVPGFNDETSSCRVNNGGTWVMYKDDQYRSSQWVVGPGEYPTASSWGGGNDDVSSLRYLGVCK